MSAKVQYEGTEGTTGTGTGKVQDLVVRNGVAILSTSTFLIHHHIHHVRRSKRYLFVLDFKSLPPRMCPDFIHEYDVFS